MKTLNAIALALLIVGGLNWLLVGLFQYDLVAGIFGGQDSTMSRIIYTLVGISAIYAFKFFNDVTNDEVAR
ncbi:MULTISPECIES: DUF378 domain-containing protein [Paenibacillus]|jgi:uncharacterized membrane protein YuzA (DUF378 family)|uniref:DUF378 domain-containing protein n=2 Tax=Paenibacillus barengoltzii TaxID=343517 RepID=R9L8F1_9BACL|nr:MULTISPECIES: DUF378 domain-containing protein [Paenibacillus]EOS54666.1 hypothetical protein C812_03441 [Paenibacillus barengoltzii G22]MDU0328616.1 DUF378 domain-containing protein [Paenibacillus sp. 3LSP]MEC2342532.1 DUF378 domain-containing protein [Paenibacillus barengoltzii]SME99769.1 hypothetical protein SAMN02744102_00812 [Paenibacillus barengoltzii]SMF10125.1 hypothetical protein SAMN02744124_01308 [Paenibacillus barengoltzii J12]